MLVPIALRMCLGVASWFSMTLLLICIVWGSFPFALGANLAQEAFSIKGGYHGRLHPSCGDGCGCWRCYHEAFGKARRDSLNMGMVQTSTKVFLGL